MAFEPEHRAIGYADRVDVDDQNRHCFYPHRHDQLEFLFVVRGRYAFTVEGHTEEFEEGEICVINCGEEHEGKSLLPAGETGMYFYLQLSIRKVPRGINAELDTLLEQLATGESRLPLRISAKRAAESGLFEQGKAILDCFSFRKGYNEFKVFCESLRVYQLLLEHRLYTDAEHREHSDDPFVQELTDYIDRHYAEELRLERLANLWGYEPHYFCAVFKKRFNKTFVKYVNSVRLQKFLSHPQLNLRTIAQCAAEVGFTNYSYFYRIFRRVYGDSPGNYILRHRN